MPPLSNATIAIIIARRPTTPQLVEDTNVNDMTKLIFIWFLLACFRLGSHYCKTAQTLMRGDCMDEVVETRHLMYVIE